MVSDRQTKMHRYLLQFWFLLLFSTITGHSFSSDDTLKLGLYTYSGRGETLLQPQSIMSIHRSGFQ